MSGIKYTILLFLLLLGGFNLSAQTTINTNLTGSTSTAGPTVTFAIKNNNTYGILITDVLNYHNTVNNGVTYTLWYSSTQLTGTPTITTPNWTQHITGSAVSLTASAITPVITNVNLVVPPNTTYRMAIVHSNTSGSVYYASSGAGTTYSAGGVDMLVGNHPTTPGCTGGFPTTTINTGRWLCGGVTFINACMPPDNLNASGITSNSANLSWDPVSGSAGYEYVVNTSATPPGGAGTPISGTSVSQTGLSSSTTYYLHVRNSCGTSFSNYETYSFTTSNNPCPYPTGINVNAPTASSANITWAAMPGSLGYEYVIDQVSAPPLGAGTPTSTTSAAASGLTGGATYYFHVRNKCSSTGGTWSDWNNHQFVMPECHKPTNILFANITGTSVDVIWSLMAAANFYQYQVDNTPDDPSSGSGYATTASMSAPISSLAPDTKYYFHVRSMCFINDSSGWALDSFVTTAYCTPPFLEVVNPNTSSPSASWDAVPTAVAYEWALRSSSTPPAFGAEISDTYLNNISLPFDGKDYYLHVRSKCNSMFSFSSWSSAPLRTGVTGVVNMKNEVAGLKIYPNPAGSFINVELIGAEKEDANVSVTNVVGQVVIKTSGDNRKIDISALPKGIYVLKYDTGEKVFTGRFMKE
jgi:Fibronectin type III domain.